MQLVAEVQREMEIVVCKGISDGHRRSEHDVAGHHAQHRMAELVLEQLEASRSEDSPVPPIQTTSRPRLTSLLSPPYPRRAMAAQRWGGRWRAPHRG